MKNKINIHLVEFEDKDSWIKGSSKFPRMFKEAYLWMEEIEGGYEEEFSEFVETEFIHYKFKDEEEILVNLKAKPGFNIFICGSHFISYPALLSIEKELKLKKEEVSYLQFDFHPDLRDVYEGRKLSHATMSKRIVERGINIVQIGIGEQSIEDLFNAKKYGVKQYFNLPNEEELLKNLKDKVYLSYDVDAFTFFSNVSTPSLSKIGESSFELIKKIFEKREVVGLDLVELLNDKADVMKAAQLIRKSIFFKFKENKNKN